MAFSFPSDWSLLDKGANISLVCSVLVFDFEHDRHIMKTLPGQQRFFLAGLLEAGFESYSIFDATLTSQYPVPSVALTPTSIMMGHNEVTWDSLMSTVDMCSGFGGVTQGILPCGFHTAVAVDHNEPMLQLFSAVSNAPTVLGDVGDKTTIHSVWKKAGGSRTMTAGFSCQPFSSLGDRKSSADSRASCLPKLLYAAFYLRMQIVVLECVAPAAHDPFVKAELAHFCDVTGFSCSQRSIKLDQVWPCKRHRSWWVLTAPLIGTIPIPEFCCVHVVPTVENLIPRILPWDRDDEESLKLSIEECLAFGGSDGDFSKYILNKNGISPCALHAWGNQLTACPCGCRQQGLSQHRLAEKGLYGLLVQSAPEGEGGSFMRHVHPCEAQALNGMDPTLDYGLNPRLTLSAVGQIASPLHVLWIMSVISARLHELRFGKETFNSETQLQAYMSWLLMKCDQVWPHSDGDARIDKFMSLIPCWKRVEHLSLEELMFPQRWLNQIDGPVTIASILDVLFREYQTQQALQPSIAHDDDHDMSEVETPWMEFPTQTPKSDCPDINVAFCTVIFDGDFQAPVQLSPLVGSTLQELLVAHEKLVGPRTVSSCVDAYGQALPESHCLSGGDLILVHFERPDDFHESPKHDESKHEAVKPTCLDPEISPTAEWTQPVRAYGHKPSVYDIGECTAAHIGNQPEWLNAEPLKGLKAQQFLLLSNPHITTPQQLWSVRNQFLKVQDRLAILEHQGPITSDDELRFHLYSLTQKYIDVQVQYSKDPVKQLVTIDPLIASAWLKDQAFSCEDWGKDHGFIHSQSLPVATVFKVGSHWVPVVMTPCGDVLNVFVWDADGTDHIPLNTIIERVGLAVGFVTVRIQRDRRMFLSTDLCGTLAIAFLQSTLLRTQLPSTPEETIQFFQKYRSEFTQSLSSCDITRRPWVWAAGDVPRSSTQVPENVPELGESIQVPSMLSRDQ